MQEHKETLGSNKQRSITPKTGFYCPSPSPDGLKEKYPLVLGVSVVKKYY
jgi:hypothetical protein